LTALTIVQGAADLLGLPRPASIGGSDTTTRQLLALTQEEGEELSRRHDWRGLIVPASITGDGSALAFDLPPDFARLASGAALWRENTLVMPLVGPVSNADWVAITNSITVGVQKAYRLIGGTIEVYPAMAANEVVRLEYISSHWVISADSLTRRSEFKQDADYGAIPERLLKLGLRWRWRAQKGLDYAQAQDTYEQELSREAFSDRGARPIAMGSACDADLAPLYAPDTITVV
jgi:hypothetical protein